jgi:hypothetical protein
LVPLNGEKGKKTNEAAFPFTLQKAVKKGYIANMNMMIKKDRGC